jgi:hypothetical protein
VHRRFDSAAASPVDDPHLTAPVEQCIVQESGERLDRLDHRLSMEVERTGGHTSGWHGVWARETGRSRRTARAPGALRLRAFNLGERRDDDAALDLDPEPPTVQDLADDSLAESDDVHGIAWQERHRAPHVLREDLGGDLAVDIRQPEVPALEPVCQARVIDAEQVQDRGLEIVDGHRV